MLKISTKDQPEVEVFNGVVRRTLGGGRDVLLARFEYKKGSEVPPHTHSYEQVTTILKGEQKIIIVGEEETQQFKVKAGETYVVPANFQHQQKTLKESVTIDAWSLAP